MNRDGATRLVRSRRVRGDAAGVPRGHIPWRAARFREPRETWARPDGRAQAGTTRGDARGIRLGSLLAIVKTKGRDRTTTVLDYVVAGLLKRGHARALRDVVGTLEGPVAAAAKQPVSDFANEASRLREGTRARAEISRSVLSRGRRQHANAAKIIQRRPAGLANARRLSAEAAAALQAVEGELLPAERAGMAARDRRARRRRVDAAETPAGAAYAGRRVARLGPFVAEAARSLDALDRLRLAPMDASLRALCEYFGEEMSTCFGRAKIDQFPAVLRPRRRILEAIKAA